jgi:hypothetical protein
MTPLRVLIGLMVLAYAFGALWLLTALPVALMAP